MMMAFTVDGQGDRRGFPCSDNILSDALITTLVVLSDVRYHEVSAVDQAKPPAVHVLQRFTVLFPVDCGIRMTLRGAALEQSRFARGHFRVGRNGAKIVTEYCKKESKRIVLAKPRRIPPFPPFPLPKRYIDTLCVCGSVVSVRETAWLCACGRAWNLREAIPFSLC